MAARRDVGNLKIRQPPSAAIIFSLGEFDVGRAFDLPAFLGFDELFRKLP
jgi:hypothetical protein